MLLSTTLRTLFLSAAIFCTAQYNHAQTPTDTLQKHLNILASPAMYGRGYTNAGVDSAANYIQNNFETFGLHSFPDAPNFRQHYNIDVNTFPGKVTLGINGVSLTPGKDFIVNASSSGTRVQNKKVKVLDLAECKDSISWEKIKTKFKKNGAYVLNNIDTLTKYRKLTMRTFAKDLNKGFFVVPMPKKLTWFATGEVTPATILYVLNSSMITEPKKVSSVIESKLIPSYPNQNIIGYIPGTEQPDSFYVFSAHFDHLGEMGSQTVFPGANDNASGVSMMLYLAEYFAKNPPKYSVAFMAFSGEEVWLKGSGYYAENPLFDLKKIKLVLNMDMMSDATNGLSIINGLHNPEVVSALERINTSHTLLPSLRSADQSKNSDHYSFSAKGVPAVFLYTNGLKPYYHDIYDTAMEVDFVHGEAVLKLIKLFIETSR